MLKNRLTIVDVAARAGVSVATVSRVVNGRYGVAEKTAARVRQVIDEMGYASNLVAQSLRGEKTGVIGVLMSRIEPFGTEILSSVSDTLQDTGYELIVFCPTSEHAEGWERRSLARLGGTLVDGSLLVAPTVVDIPSERPVVAIDPHVGATHLSTVAAENLEGAVAATRHLIELGHRRIGFLGGRADLESARQREAGYRAALTAADLPIDLDLIQNGDFTEAGAEEPARRLLSLPDRPTSIFAANDRSAMYVLSLAEELGLDVPSDLSVVGFDNVRETRMTTPPLTTVDQSIRSLGSEGVRLLLDLIDHEGETHEPIHRLLPVQLVVRGSTAPPRSPNPSR